MDITFEQIAAGFKIFKNKNFTKRHYNATQKVACIAKEAPDGDWIEGADDLPGNLTKLYIQNGVEYWGYM